MFSVFKKIFSHLIKDAKPLWNILSTNNFRSSVSCDLGFNLKGYSKMTFIFKVNFDLPGNGCRHWCELMISLIYR
jgi:hypothetical protein